MNNKRVVITALTAIGFCVSLSCCQDSIQNTPADYFPLSNSTKWRYQRQELSTADDSTVYSQDTLKFQVDIDTVFNGITYKKIIDSQGFTKKLIRVNGAQYFERTHDNYIAGENNELFTGYSNEVMFLDVDKPEGTSWIAYDDVQRKVEYIIKEKNSTQNILGTVYKDVIKVDANVYYQELGQYKYWLTSSHYYAKNVGEVYSFIPYPLSYRYTHLRSFLIK